jgi:TPR repeat protein
MSLFSLSAILSFLQMNTPLSILLLYSSSTNDDALAQLSLGFKHHYGVNVPEKCETAAQYYLQVARNVSSHYSNSIPEHVKLPEITSFFATESKYKSLGEVSLLESVSKKDPNAAFYVAEKLMLGSDGHKRDLKRAVQLLEYHPDHPGCLALLGYIYIMGLGADKNETEARNLFERAIFLYTNKTENSDPLAPLDPSVEQFNAQTISLAYNGLGYLRYHDGETDEAYTYFNTSATLGSADGVYNLATMQLQKKLYTKSYLMYTISARQGHTPSLFALAQLSLNGIGTVKSCPESVKYLKMISEKHSDLKNLYDSDDRLLANIYMAETGYEIAQYNLGVMIDEMTDTEFMKTVDRLLLAINIQLSQLNITNILIDKSQIAHKSIIANHYINLASNQGHIPSKVKLAQWYKEGKGVQVDMHDKSLVTVTLVTDIDYSKYLFEKVIEKMEEDNISSKPENQKLIAYSYFSLAMIYLDEFDYETAKEYFDLAYKNNQFMKYFIPLGLDTLKYLKGINIGRTSIIAGIVTTVIIAVSIRKFSNSR